MFRQIANRVGRRARDRFARPQLQSQRAAHVLIAAGGAAYPAIDQWDQGIFVVASQGSCRSGAGWRWSLCCCSAARAGLGGGRGRLLFARARRQQFPARLRHPEGARSTPPARRSTPATASPPRRSRPAILLGSVARRGAGRGRAADRAQRPPVRDHPHRRAICGGDGGGRALAQPAASLPTISAGATASISSPRSPRRRGSGSIIRAS